MKWFKFECAEPESPVGRAILRRLGRAGLGSYVLLQCFVGQHGAEVGRGVNADGEPFDYDTLVDAARCTEEEFDELIGVLLEKGAIDATKWHERRELCFPDLVRRAERYAREKTTAQTQRTLSADSAPRSDQIRSEEEQKEREEGDEDVAAPLLFPVPLTETAKMQSLVDLWNSMAGPAGLPQAAGLSDGRKRHIRRRLKERSLEGWKEVFLRIAASRFCCGENERGWRASFDWIISSPEPALKVMEGKYDNRPRRPMPTRPSGAMYIPSADETAEYLERMERAAKGGR